MVKNQIVEGLKKALQELGIEDVEPKLEQPQDTSKGDYSSNVAMTAFKKYQVSSSKYKVFRTPLEFAQEIVNILNTKYLIHNTFSRVRAESPGFINFWLSNEYLITQLQELLSGTKKVGKSAHSARASTELSRMSSGRGKIVIIEFTDPNPFKEFHIGHLYSNIVGESLSRLYESQGADVWRVTYQGDVGLHVAKAIWGIQNLELRIEDLEKKTLYEKAKMLGEAYATGSKAYEEDQSAKEEINDLNKKIYEGSDPEIMQIYHKGRQWSLDYFEEIYTRLGSKFVKNYFESVAGPVGLTLVKEHIKDGVFVESDGAIIFEGKKHGLHNRVFVNSLGLPTYEAKDMGLPGIKYKDFPYDESIIITANEQSEYFKVVLKALSFVNPDLASKTRHIAHGMVKLPSGKMSSRTGSVVTGEWLLDEAKKNILEQYKDMDQDTAEVVAIGAVKYALLKSNIGSDITFDFHESINLQGNSGPYLQYTYVRTQSVIKKAEARDWKLEARNKDKLQEKEEIEVLRLLVKFDEVVEAAKTQIAPNLLCNYLFELAQAFNLFYQRHKIIESDSKDFRLALTAGVGIVLKRGLHLLGIEAPERM